MEHAWKNTRDRGQAGPGSQKSPVAGMPPAPSRSSKPAISRSVMKEIRSAVNKQSGALILYLVTMQLVGPAVSVVFLIVLQSMRHQVISVDTALAQLNGPFAGVMYLSCVSTAFVFWVLTHKKQIADPATTGIFHRHERRMTPVVLVCMVALLFTCQSISDIYSVGFTWVTEKLRLEVVTAAQQLEAASGSLSMFVYAAFFGPLVEEIIFRGVILNTLKKYNKIFAIVTSSVMFGFFHSDLTQGLFAFCAGLLLGYVACEYSIFWSIVLHIFNNLVIPGFIEFVYGFFPAPEQGWIDPVLVVVGLLMGLLVLCSKWRQIHKYVVGNRPNNSIYAAWGGLWFVTYLLLQILLTALNFIPAMSQFS